MAPEKYNLRLGDRPSHLLPGLDRITISGGPRASDFTYHHIVPYSMLRDFWNKLVESGGIRGREFFPLLREGIEKNYVDMLSPRGKLREDDARQVVDLAREINDGKASHDPESRSRPPGWDNLMGVYAWLPGNLFVGPQGRCDDPEDKLDKAAFRIIGSARVGRCDNLSKAYTEIQDYLNDTSGRKSPVPASKALRGVVKCARIQDFDGKDWIWFDGKSGPQIRGQR